MTNVCESGAPAIRFDAPDPIWGLPERDHTPGLWMNADTARSSDLMQGPGWGNFVRSTLRIALADGGEFQYGVWVAVEPGLFRGIFDVWWADEYAVLEFSGYLANAIPPGGLLEASVHVRVERPDQLPNCFSSPDDQLCAVINEVWDRDFVTEPSLLGKAAPPFVTDAPAFVQRTVLDGTLPALRVAHDSQGDWVVTDETNDPNEPGAMAMVHIEHLVALDPTVGELAALAVDHEAVRSSPNHRWDIRCMQEG